MKTLREILGKPILFHTVYYHGKDGTASPTGYLSNDPNIIGDQLSVMQAIGGEGCGVIALTYGPAVNAFIHQAVMEACRQCNARRMPFALCYDPWTVKGSGLAADQAMIMVLRHPDTLAMMNSRTYISSINGTPGKLVLDFSTGANSKNVLAASPGVNYFMKNTDFAWPNFDANSKPVPLNNKVKLPCVIHQFDDGSGADRNKQANDPSLPVRLWPSNAGNTFWQSAVSAIADNSQYVQLPTWNDVRESTDIESWAAIVAGLRIG